MCISPLSRREQSNEGELARLSWNNNIDVELNEHVRHREAGNDEASAAERDAAHVWLGQPEGATSEAILKTYARSGHFRL
jgi:hypothetical protein